MDGANRVPTLQEHYIDAQDETPLPIWRPMIYFKYPEGPWLTDTEILRLLELFRSCLLGKRAVQGVVKRTKENIHEFQRDTYQLGILTLNLGHINRVPYIGGSSTFPKCVRKDTDYRALPYLVFRNAAHIVCLCEASDEYGGIAIHQKEHGMIGMVVQPAINSQSLAILSEVIITLALSLNSLDITNTKPRIRPIRSGSSMEQSSVPRREHLR